MVTLNAHFDGKVIVPDEPLALKPNQKLRVTIEPTDAETTKQTDFAQWIGLAADGGPAHDPADEDALWENGGLRNPPGRNE